MVNSISSRLDHTRPCLISISSRRDETSLGTFCDFAKRNFFFCKPKRLELWMKMHQNFFSLSIVSNIYRCNNASRAIRFFFQRNNKALILSCLNIKTEIGLCEMCAHSNNKSTWLINNTLCRYSCTLIHNIYLITES